MRFLYNKFSIPVKNIPKSISFRACIIIFGAFLFISITHAYSHTHEYGHMHDDCPLLAYAEMVQLEPDVLFAPFVVLSLNIPEEIFIDLNNSEFKTHSDLRLPLPNAPPVVPFIYTI